jgi:NAD(P)H dehydrogenase (quinone)
MPRTSQSSSASADELRVLVVFCHPVETSFGAALKDRIVASLAPRHQVDLLDLYAENFDPVMSRAERLGYHDIPANIAPVASYVDRLMHTEAIVFCFPAWSFGPPAMLKGWFDRVMLPGVSFHIQPDGSVTGGLPHVKKLAAVVTYGQTWWRATLMGDYPRKIVRLYLRRNIGSRKPALFLAHYAMNESTPETRGRFLARVGTAMSAF